MYLTSRTTAVATTIAVMVHCLLPAWAATEATIEGTLKMPCDPSRVSEVASVQVRPVSEGSPATVPVDPTTGEFRIPGLTEGEYDLVVIGSDGMPLSPEPERLVLRAGVNKVVFSLEPPGCGETEPTREKKKDGLEDWHLTLIYFGVVGAAVIALDNDEKRASPF